MKKKKLRLICEFILGKAIGSSKNMKKMLINLVSVHVWTLHV